DGDRVAQPERLTLAHVVEVGHLSDGAHFLQLVVLAAGVEVELELEGAVEVVLERPLVASGDDEDVADAGAHGFLHDVLDGRLVDDGQHLLGLRLGRGQEPGAEPGCRYTGTHPVRVPTVEANRKDGMPTYEYACKSCGEHLEVVQSFRDEPLEECPACGGQLRKVFSPVGISFKGSGFYRNDSRSSTK